MDSYVSDIQTYFLSIKNTILSIFCQDLNVAWDRGIDDSFHIE